MEEAAEVVEAADEPGDAGRKHLVKEVADLVFHTAVLLAHRDLAWSEVEAELATAVRNQRYHGKTVAAELPKATDRSDQIMGKRVVLAMSGGVDSSVAAVLLKEQGYEVVGIFMRTGTTAEDADRRSKTCCSVADAVDAQRVADRLDIPFYALDFETRLRADQRLFRGRVPGWTDAQSLRRVQHLAQVRQAVGVWQTGRSRLRGDRSLRPDRERRRRDVARGPCGRIEPRISRMCSLDCGGTCCRTSCSRWAVIRSPRSEPLAREHGLPVHDKPDSQEICFVPDDDYLSFVRGRRPERETAGRIVDEDGKVLGEHAGIEGFTIGQRRGLGVAVGSPRYVIQIEPSQSDRDRGPEGVAGEKLGLIAARFNWQSPVPTGPIPCLAQIRAQHRAVPATVEPSGGRACPRCL